MWSAFASGGALASLELVAEDCEWLPSPDFPDAAAVRGALAMREYLERLTEEGVRFEPTLHACEQVADDAVLAAGRMRIVSPSVLSDSPHFWLYRLRDGRVVRVEAYATRQDALNAAGSR